MRAPRRLASIVRDEAVDRVIIAPPDGGFSEDILDVIRVVKDLGVRVSVLPRLFEVVGSSAEFDEVDGLTLLGVRRYGLTSSSRLVKRALDLTIAGFGFILIAPLFLFIAVAIKLDSRGPVFFRQRRMGQNDVPFDMLKFRTMIEGADEQKAGLRDRNEAGEGLFKVEDDPRITRVGRLLRRTSLDELPQLLNVLRGEMSLVGPRPLVIDEDVRIAGWRRDRLQLPPGMTGLWQVSAPPASRWTRWSRSTIGTAPTGRSGSTSRSCCRRCRSCSGGGGCDDDRAMGATPPWPRAGGGLDRGQRARRRRLVRSDRGAG